MCFSLRWRLFCVLGGIISRAEYSKSPSVSRETIPPRRLAEEGVKNWPGRRNRLPHPVCKPLDSKEGGADGFVYRAARKPIFHSFSAWGRVFRRKRPRADAWGYPAASEDATGNRFGLPQCGAGFSQASACGAALARLPQDSYEPLQRDLPQREQNSLTYGLASNSGACTRRKAAPCVSFPSTTMWNGSAGGVNAPLNSASFCSIRITC